MAFAYDHLDVTQLKKVAGSILTSWAARDPFAAMSWYRSTLESDVEDGIATFAEKETQLESIFESITKQDALTAIKEFHKLTSGDEQLVALKGIVNNVEAPENRSDFFELAESLADPTLRHIAIVGVATSLGKVDPSSVIEWLDQGNLTDQEVSMGVQSLYHSKRSTLGPAAAADWYVREERSGVRLQDRLMNISGFWGDDNPEALSQWMEKEIEPGLEMDDTIGSLSHRFGAESRADLALEWAFKITDPKLQAHRFLNILSNWAAKDQVAAQQWFENANLAPEVLKSLENDWNWRMP